MKDAKLKSKLLKEYEESKVEFKTPTTSAKRNKWLDKIIKEYHKDGKNL